MRRLIFVTALSAVLLNGTSALAAEAGSPSKDDPWEGLNRKLYSISQGLDRAIIRPAAMAYQRVAPAPFRMIIRDFLSNLSEPKVIANDILQLRPARAAEATGRFLVNSTIGIGGLFDVATKIDLPGHENSFSITLGRYGVGQGPYVYLLAPSTVRSLIGSVADGAMSPLYWIRYPHKTEVSIGLGVVHALDLRAEADGALKSLTADATDPYATIRSAYLQNQQSLVNGDSEKVQSLPDFDDATSPSSPAPPPAAPDPKPSAENAAPTADPPRAEPTPKEDAPKEDDDSGTMSSAPSADLPA